MHVGRADFGLYQSDVTDFTRSLLPESLAAKVARDPGVAAVAKVKLLVVDGTLVFGLDPHEFAYRRFVVVAGARGAVMAGDHSGKRRRRRVRCSAALVHRRRRLPLGRPLRGSRDRAPARARSRRSRGGPGEVTSIGVTVKLGANVAAVARAARAPLSRARRDHRAGPGDQGRHVEPADHLDRLDRLDARADRRRDRRDEHDGDVGVRADARDRDPARRRLAGRRGSAR